MNGLNVAALAVNARLMRAHRRAARLALQLAQSDVVAAEIATERAERQLADAIQAALFGDQEAQAR